MPKILVFDGSGFIGSHLLRRLSSETNVELISVDIVRPKIEVLGVNYLYADVCDLSGFDVDGEVAVIYNLAAVHTTPGHPSHEYYETNIRGATEITAFARRKGLGRIIFTSSISVYGPNQDRKTENTPPSPESAYGWSKYLAEGIHRSWLEEDEGRQLVICRPAVIFGYREGGNFTRMASLLRKGFFIYPGRRDTIKACFYVEDLLSSIFEAQVLNERYILFNGAYPDRCTIEQIIAAMKKNAFPAAFEITVPKWIVILAAEVLKPFSILGLGIHPDRVLKLIRSTHISPGGLRRGAWQVAAGFPPRLKIGKTRAKADSTDRR